MVVSNKNTYIMTNSINISYIKKFRFVDFIAWYTAQMDHDKKYESETFIIANYGFRFKFLNKNELLRYEHLRPIKLEFNNILISPTPYTVKSDINNEIAIIIKAKTIYINELVDLIKDKDSLEKINKKLDSIQNILKRALK